MLQLETAKGLQSAVDSGALPKRLASLGLPLASGQIQYTQVGGRLGVRVMKHCPTMPAHIANAHTFSFLRHTPDAISSLQLGVQAPNHDATQKDSSDSDEASSSSAGAMAGGIVGGIAALALVAVIVVTIRRKRRAAQATASAEAVHVGATATIHAVPGAPKGGEPE